MRNTVKYSNIIPAVLIELDYKGYFQRYALTPEEFQKEFGERLALDMPVPISATAETYTLRPMVHIWYCNTAVGDDLWNTFFTDMAWGLSEGDIASGNLAYIEYSEMKSLVQYLPKTRIESLIDSSRVNFEETYVNEEYDTITYYFSADKMLLASLFPGQYPEAEGMTISIELPNGRQDAMAASVMVSPTLEGSDYDWAELGLSFDVIEKLLSLTKPQSFDEIMKNTQEDQAKVQEHEADSLEMDR